VLFSVISRGLTRGIPALPSDVLRYIRKMNDPSQLVDALAARVESVYGAKLRDSLALMRAFPSLKPTDFTRA
jgi:hypothetical protein